MNTRPLRAAATAAAVVFLVLTLLVALSTSWLLRLDRALSGDAADAVHAHHGLLTAARITTYFGNPAIVDAVLAVLAVGFAVARRWPWVVAVVATGVAGWSLDQVVKRAVGRARPHPAHPVAHALGASFPSGHSTGAAEVAVLLATFVLTAPVPRRRLQIGLAGLLLVVAVAVAASRVLLVVHYPSDVLAGLALGTTAATACLWACLRPRAVSEPP